MSQALIREFVSLTKRKRGLEAELSPIEDKLKSMQQPLLDYFERESMQRQTVDGMTVYLRSQTWAFPEDEVERREVVEALKQVGLDDFVKEDYNTNSLSAYARELEQDDRDLLDEYPELKERLRLIERFDVRAVAAK